MKTKIHPQFHEDATVVCACGHTFTTGSTKKEIHVEVCYRCHPFYTGKHKYLDIKGRVNLFQRKQAIAKKMQSVRKTSKKVKKQGEKKAKSLKELLGSI